MESLFFNITDTRYKITEIFRKQDSFFRRIDISNGVLFFNGTLYDTSQEIRLKNIDSFVMVVLVKEGECLIEDHIKNISFKQSAASVSIYVSSLQDMTITLSSKKCSDVFILFVADFFLKRYLSGLDEEPIDYLYTLLRERQSLKLVDQKPLDALSLYLVQKIISVKSDSSMRSLRAQKLIIEFILHRFELLDIVPKTITAEDIALAKRAKEILLRDFISPPPIATLARLCATNSSKLKRVFKLVYKTTIYGYIQRLRLEEANLLLKEQTYTIAEVAKMVGYKHQGHFSKLFFKVYGVYPKELIKNFR